FEFRNDLLSTRGCDAAEDVAGFRVTQDFAAERRIVIEPTLRITFDYTKRDVEPGIGIYLFHTLHYAGAACARQGRIDAAAREEDPYVYNPPHLIPIRKNPASIRAHARSKRGSDAIISANLA